MVAIRIKNISHIAMEKKHIPNALQFSKLTPGVSYSTIKRFWHGFELKYIAVQELTAIAKVLEVKPLDLLEDIEEVSGEEYAHSVSN